MLRHVNAQERKQIRNFLCFHEQGVMLTQASDNSLREMQGLDHAEVAARW